MDSISRRETVAAFSYDELFVEQGIHKEVIFTVRQNILIGRDFVDLTEDLLKELFPVVGSRLVISRIVKSCASQGKLPATGILLNQYEVLPHSPAASKWVTTFDIPNTFSKKTMKAIATSVSTKSARTEIINALHSRMIQYKTYPTSYEYKTACNQLITRHPTLMDRTASGYGTWKEQLEQKFRNSRRPDKKEKEQLQKVKEIQSSSDKQPKTSKSKNLRIASQDANVTDEVDKDKYVHKLEKLKEELAKDEPKNKRVKRLMKDTFNGRRQWVLKDAPKVSDILSMFPPLKKSARLQEEFCMILGLEKNHNFLKNWPQWERKIFQLAEIEADNRPSIKYLLSNFHAAESSDNDLKIHSLLLLTGFLAARAKTKLVYEYLDTIDFDAEMQQLPPAPSIVVLRSDSGRQFYITVENQVLLESEDMSAAVIELFAAFFVFDIAYPKSLYPVYIFIQHQMLGIIDSQVVPNVTSIIVSNMDKL